MQEIPRAILRCVSTVILPWLSLVFANIMHVRLIDEPWGGGGWGGGGHVPGKYEYQCLSA